MSKKKSSTITVVVCWSTTIRRLQLLISFRGHPCNIYEKKSLEIMLTIFVITIVRKELFEIRLTTQQLPFLHSNILCKIVVNDLLNNQNILKDIFEEKRGQRQK